MIREMYFSNAFYPANKNEVLEYFVNFNKQLDVALKNPDILQKNPIAIIVPHAGYVYSGINANIAYRAMDKKSKKFIVIGPSHHYGFSGISVGNFLEYSTPLGILQAGVELVKELDLPFIPQAHKEHSTEVQFPFIKYHFPQSNIVEVVYGKTDYKDVKKVIKTAYTLGYKIIISTDLSHFYTLDEAKKLDNICMYAVDKLDLSAINQGCEACGKTGVEAIIDFAKEQKLQSGLLHYSTSADASGDKNRVVGYLSAQLFRRDD